MKARPPTLRLKKRYILARIDPPWICPAPKDLAAAFNQALTGLYGDKTSAEAEMGLISFESGFAEIRCRRGYEMVVRTALSTVISVNEEAVAVRSLVTSGTLSGIRKRRTGILRQIPEESGDEELLGKIYSVRRYPCQKVDLVEKGIKGQELLFLTQDDLEEF